MTLPDCMAEEFAHWRAHFLANPSRRGGCEHAALLEMIERRKEHLCRELNDDSDSVATARVAAEIALLLAECHT